MQKTKFACTMMLSVLALVVGLATQPILAQSAAANKTAAQQQPMQPGDQNAANAASEKTFNGTIVKSGDKLVLTAADKTTYQLDDQQKAQYFLNKSVKVKGVLDASTGTIRVTAIDPA